MKKVHRYHIPTEWMTLYKGEGDVEISFGTNQCGVRWKRIRDNNAVCYACRDSNHDFEPVEIVEQ